MFSALVFQRQNLSLSAVEYAMNQNIWYQNRIHLKGMLQRRALNDLNYRKRPQKIKKKLLLLATSAVLLAIKYTEI